MNPTLKAAIDSAKYISFDVFDTAILRTVGKPTDIFMIVQEIYNRRNENIQSNFCDWRIQAESTARENFTNGDKEDITLCDIYQCYSDMCHDKQTASVLQQLEVAIEKQFTKRNQYIYEVYQYCVQNNKPVIFISDMYLNTEDIRFILLRAGYDRFIDVYVSSTVGKAKYTGNLFKIVIDELDCTYADLLHIGDNSVSDVAVPSGLGVHTSHYVAPEMARTQDQKTNFRCTGAQDGYSVYEAISNGLINMRFYSNPDRHCDDFWYEFGYRVLGSISLGFTKWLIERIKRDNSDVVCFLSRDAYLFKRLVDLLLPDAQTKYNCKYIYISRRAIRLATMKGKILPEDLSYLVGNSDVLGLTVAKVFKRLGIDPRKHLGVLEKYGLKSLDYIIRSPRDCECLLELFKNSDIQYGILRAAETERNCLIGYLEQEGIMRAPNITLVDIGWNGNLQRSFEDLLGDDFNVKGYYFATLKTALEKKAQGHSLEGYLVNNGTPSVYETVIYQNLTLLETIFTAPHGSVVRFEQELNGTFAPRFGEFKVNKLEMSRILRIHDGIFDFIKDFSSIIAEDFPLDFNREHFIKEITRLRKYPSQREATLLGDLSHFDFGRVINLAKPLPRYRYMITPLSGLRHWRESIWKEAYMCRLFGPRFLFARLAAQKVVKGLRARR